MPIRPGNEADPWEAEALALFEAGAGEYSSIETVDGEPYMRLIRPLVTEAGCLKCHAGQGYVVGDVRGGISVSVPMAPIAAASARTERAVVHGHAALWALGMLGIALAWRRIRQRMTERDFAEAQLAERNVFLDSVLESLSHPFVVTDIATRQVVMANSEAVEVAGTRQGRCFEVLHGRERPCAEDGHVCLHAEVISRGRDTVVEHTVTGDDGDVRHVEIQGYPIRDAEGRIVQLIQYSRDVTERRRIEAELQRSQKLEAMGQLAGGLAHEINSPIQFILNNVQFLGEGLEDVFKALDEIRDVENEVDPEALERLRRKWQALEDDVDLPLLREEMPRAVKLSDDGLHRISTIVKAMMDVSHPGCTESEPMDLNVLIESSIFVSRNKWSGVAEFETDLDATIPDVACVPGEFSQIVLNLVFNAADAIAEARERDPSREGRIRVTSRSDGETVEVCVTDNGPGIPESIRHRIFDPFFSTKGPGVSRGQGLSAVHAMVRTLDGSISFETETGLGTTFRLSFPAAGRVELLT